MCILWWFLSVTFMCKNTPYTHADRASSLWKFFDVYLGISLHWSFPHSPNLQKRFFPLCGFFGKLQGLFSPISLHSVYLWGLPSVFCAEKWTVVSCQKISIIRVWRCSLPWNFWWAIKYGFTPHLHSLTAFIETLPHVFSQMFNTVWFAAIWISIFMTLKN